MYSAINKYKNIKFKPNDITFLPLTKLSLPNYTCNKEFHVKDNFYYITCNSNYPELCTESQHNMLVANELNRLNEPFSLKLSSREVNYKENIEDQFKKLIKERQINRSIL